VAGGSDVGGVVGGVVVGVVVGGGVVPLYCAATWASSVPVPFMYVWFTHDVKAVWTADEEVPDQRSSLSWSK
jgi:hypothetical protein